jgi:hypothetical protein
LSELLSQFDANHNVTIEIVFCISGFVPSIYGTQIVADITCQSRASNCALQGSIVLHQVDFSFLACLSHIILSLGSPRFFRLENRSF